MRPDLLAFYQMMQNRQQNQMPINSVMAQPVMSQPVMDYAEQQMESPPEEQNSPIQRGLSLGRSASQRSIETNDEQKKRAFGLALMQFGSSLGRPGYGSGFGGTLNAINQSLNPAVEAYQQEEARNASINAYMQQQEAAEQKELANELYRQQQLQNQQQKQEELEIYHNAQIGIGEKKISSQEAKEEKKLAQKQKHHQERLGVMMKEIEKNVNRNSQLNTSYLTKAKTLENKMYQDGATLINEFDPERESKLLKLKQNIKKELQPIYSSLGLREDLLDGNPVDEDLESEDTNDLLSKWNE